MIIDVQDKRTARFSADVLVMIAFPISIPDHYWSEF
jgi:hypothetical protein